MLDALALVSCVLVLDAYDAVPALVLVLDELEDGLENPT